MIGSWRHSLRQSAPWSAHRISHRSDVGSARRWAQPHLHSRRPLWAAVSLSVTELGTNLQRHARQGVLFQGPGVLPGTWEVFSVDRGPGLPDGLEVLVDGVSTGGSLGSGLGAVMRSSSAWSIEGTGRTRIHARFGGEDGPAPIAVMLPKLEGTACGDAWVARRHRGFVRVGIFDGSGSGERAREVARRACRVVEAADPEVPLDEVMRGVHEALTGAARGAVGTVVDVRRERVRSVGVGNTTAALVGPERVRSLPRHEGLLGRALPELRVESTPCSPAHTLMLWTDGFEPVFTPGEGAGLLVASGLESRRPLEDAGIVALPLGALLGAP